ncbi:MAG: flagellar basal body rod protein FlgC [Phycisphaeraceae bacterium]|nr:flagellar basal body rod protein FlgC [Phycisphaeraceae bacterium]
MYGALDISVSGMVAQRTRLAVIAANVANQNTLEDAKGNYSPYLRREIMFSAGDPNGSGAARELGVHVSDIFANPGALRSSYEPGSPYDDDGDGYIMVPDINPIVEQVNALEAARSYEANVMAAEATKTMMAQALRLIA